jgi:glutamyl-tRNA synthetase/glutamyl-Q tRNA(Asp) synthetase
MARARGGRVLLRIEDHDRIRSRPEFETAILEDLDWLGFEADEGRSPVARQSDRQPAYEEALRSLRSRHLVYACGCSRREIGAERYPGTCRARGLSETAGVGLRVEIGPGAERFEDLLLGSLSQTPAGQCGDLLVKDRDGHWTYQFAVTVDDLRDGVTLVIRGADLLTSTGRQIRLARMLGRAEPPRFAHHPLVMGPGGQKLSKSLADTGVRELRRAGVGASEVIGRAAFSVGLLSVIRPLAAHEVPGLFT